MLQAKCKRYGACRGVHGLLEHTVAPSWPVSGQSLHLPLQVRSAQRMGINEPNQQFPSFLMPANTCYLALASGLLFFFSPFLLIEFIASPLSSLSTHCIFSWVFQTRNAHCLGSIVYTPWAKQKTKGKTHSSLPAMYCPSRQRRRNRCSYIKVIAFTARRFGWGRVLVSKISNHAKCQYVLWHELIQYGIIDINKRKR